MIYYVTKEQMKSCERFAFEHGISSAVLMDNAGTAAARAIRKRFSLGSMNIAVVCGRGNNGGDGFVAARKLKENGARVTVILAGGAPSTPDAAVMFNRAVSMGIPVADASSAPDDAVRFLAFATLIVDAVYGTGFHVPLASADRWLFGEMNRRGVPVVALDLPSGTDSDSGEADPDCVKASLTVAFQYKKRGHLYKSTARSCGEIITVEIGIPPLTAASIEGVMCSPDKSDIAAFFSRRDEQGNKGSYGRALLVCGSKGMAGAAALAAKGCLKSGAGLCELAVPDTIYPVLAARLYEPVYTVLNNFENISTGDTLLRIGERLKKASSCLVGCGISTSRRAAALTDYIIKNAACPLVIDADGINNIAAHIDVLKEANVPVIITPHPGEMSRLCGRTVEEIQNNRINTAVDFSLENGVITVLKGHETIVACPDGRCFINTTGNAGMATGGSGDVLAGMIASLLAQGFEPENAAMCAVWIHGAAGDAAADALSQTAMLPTDIINSLPLIFAELERI